MNKYNFDILLFIQGDEGQNRVEMQDKMSFIRGIDLGNKSGGEQAKCLSSGG